MASTTSETGLNVALNSLSISSSYSLEDLVPSEGTQTIDLFDLCALSNTRLATTKLHSIYCCHSDSDSGFYARSLLIRLLQPQLPDSWLRIERRMDTRPVFGHPEWLADAPLDVVRALVVAYICCTTFTLS